MWTCENMNYENIEKLISEEGKYTPNNRYEM